MNTVERGEVTLRLLKAAIDAEMNPPISVRGTSPWFIHRLPTDHTFPPPLSPHSSPPPMTPPTPTAPGTGRLFLSATTPSTPAQFTHLAGCYPLKLLAPTPLPSQPAALRAAYMLAYGGGLVAGDTISLHVRIGEGSRLVLLTQGSTKVFKTRVGLRPLAHGSAAEASSRGQGGDVVTRQRLLVELSPGALLLLLPDPIQPFKSSSYIQSQRFVLPPPTPGSLPANILLLDWYTSGRNAGGHTFQEEWEFALYASLNEITHATSSIPLMREKTTLRPAGGLQARMRPYQTYATLLIHGPLFAPLIAHLAARTVDPAETQFQASRPAPLVWSFSNLERTAEVARAGREVVGPGGIVRVAGMETEAVKRWIEGVLVKGQVRDLVGDALWSRIF